LRRRDRARDDRERDTDAKKNDHGERTDGVLLFHVRCVCDDDDCDDYDDDDDAPSSSHSIIRIDEMNRRRRRPTDGSSTD